MSIISIILMVLPILAIIMLASRESSQWFKASGQARAAGIA